MLSDNLQTDSLYYYALQEFFGSETLMAAERDAAELS